MLATVRPDQIHQCVVMTLQAAAFATGDSRYRVALGITAGACGGRPASRDAAALELMARAIATGRASNPTAAARLALEESAGGMSAAAVKRLVRKHRDAGR